MALNVPSFFAGIGTVLALLILGFGGGVLMSGVISDSPRERGKVEKWAAEAQKAPVVAATPVPAPPPVHVCHSSSGAGASCDSHIGPIGHPQGLRRGAAGFGSIRATAAATTRCCVFSGFFTAGFIVSDFFFSAFLTGSAGITPNGTRATGRPGEPSGGCACCRGARPATEVRESQARRGES